jgi:hypothetical protein
MDAIPYWHGSVPVTGWAVATTATVFFAKLGPLRFLWVNQVTHAGPAGGIVLDLTYDLSTLRTLLGSDWCTIGNLGTGVTVYENSAVDVPGIATLTVGPVTATLVVSPIDGTFTLGEDWGHNGFVVSWIEPGFPITL